VRYYVDGSAVRELRPQRAISRHDDLHLMAPRRESTDSFYESEFCPSDSQGVRDPQNPHQRTIP
jgi:hypothetical protein